MTCKVTNIEELTQPKFLKPSLVSYVDEKGIERKWEMGQSNDSVHVLVFNKDQKVFHLVTQCRIPVLVNDPGTNGMVTECCAGLLDDPDAHIKVMAQREILQELGYQVDVDSIVYMNKAKSNVGLLGRDVFMYYAEVSDSDKVSEGGGLEAEGENITVTDISDYRALQIVLGNDSMVTDTTTLYMLSWYYLARPGYVQP